MTPSDTRGGTGAPSGLPRWPVRLADVPPSGLHIRRRELPAADLAAFARFIGVEAMTALDVDLHVKPYRGDGLAVSGRVRAEVGQICVVTLEPMTNSIDEEVEATFRPEEKLKPHLVRDEEDGLSIDASVAADDPLVGGTIDAAAIAAEFLALGVDPYPRKSDSRFEVPSSGSEVSPFAGLSKLKRDT